MLDNDVGGDIGVIINKCKNPVFVRLTAEGVPAHGSTPWDGLDANEMLMRTIAGLRRFYPYFDINNGKPANAWIDTMHAARISGAMFQHHFRASGGAVGYPADGDING